MSTITTSPISSVLQTSTTTALSATSGVPNATSVSHTFPPHHTPPSAPYRGPGDGRPKSGQPNLIFGFVVAFLLIFIIVMGGGMAARVYGERQRRAAAAAEERRSGPDVDAPPPPTHEAWLAPGDQLNASYSWGSMRPLAASLVPKRRAAADPATAASTGSVPAPPRELYAGRMIGRGGGALPLLPAQLSTTSTTSRRGKEAQAPEETVLSTAVLVRMPDPNSRMRRNTGQEIELKRAQQAEPLAGLEIGLCELPWRGGDLQ